MMDKCNGNQHPFQFRALATPMEMCSNGFFTCIGRWENFIGSATSANSNYTFRQTQWEDMDTIRIPHLLDSLKID